MKKKRQYIQVVTINVNGLNSPNKRNQLAEWIKKRDLTIYFIQETYLNQKEIHKLKVKGWKTILYTTGTLKKAQVAILFANDANFKPQLIKGDKKSHYILVKGKLQEEITVINMNAPNTSSPNYIKQI